MTLKHISKFLPQPKNALNKSICCRECNGHFKQIATTQDFCFPCLLKLANDAYQRGSYTDIFNG